MKKTSALTPCCIACINISSISTLLELDSAEIAVSISCEIEELEKHTQLSGKDLNIITQNIRSIYKNTNDLLLNLSRFTCEVDVLILTECRLNVAKPIPVLDNYISYHTTKHINQNDGVVAYIKNNHQATVTEICVTDSSALQIVINNCKILGIYRSPSNTNANNFIQSLSSQLGSIVETKNTVIIGDININLISKPSETSVERCNRLNYLDILSSFGLLPGHLLSTRENSCLDHVMLKLDKPHNSAFIAVLKTTVTDHNMVLLKITQSNKTQDYTYKSQTICNLENACKTITDYDMSHLYTCNDPNVFADTLIRDLKEAILSNTSIKLISNNKKILKPWMTSGVVRCIRLRNDMQIKLKADPYNLILKITYKRFRNFCYNLIRKLKRIYNKNKIMKSINHPRSLWKAVNDITNFKPPKTTNTELLHINPLPLESVNHINRFFASVGKTLAEEITKQSASHKNNHSTDVVNTQLSSFVMLDTYPEEVDNILMGLDSSSAPGWDGISNKFLKLARVCVVPLISQLANLCFKTGIFPKALKRSIITPVYKNGARDDANNYRPISVLPSISKIIEKLIDNRLRNYLNKFKILSNSQFGFRKGLSTQDAITELTSLITDEVDKKNKCVTVFLDLKKAFDTISVPILVRRLESIGIRGTALSLFESYLQDRTQAVKIDKYCSNEQYISFGVPQGSVLGPTLFLIYINQLCEVGIAGGRIFSYADDTAVVCTGKTWDSVKRIAEVGLANIASWLNSNLLTLNVAKTNYICFAPYVNSQPALDFGIRIHTCGNSSNRNCNCSPITKVKETKYLGIIIDQRLSWHSHLELIMGRVRKLVWIFKTLRHVMVREMLAKIYIALVQSIIIYCIPVWGGATKTKFIDIERAQRSLLKVMYCKPYKFSTDALYKIDNLLSVRKLYILHMTQRCHKSLPFNQNKQNKRRNDIVAHSRGVRTAFAGRQYKSQSAFVYNQINKTLQIYPMKQYDCKKTLIQWLNTLTYEEVENLLGRIL